MNQLHKALETLRPIKWADVPVDDLASYLHDSFVQAELIINSVPPLPGGDAFGDSRRTFANGAATKASEMLSSQARPPTPDTEMMEMSKGWGKPLKMSDKDNPLGLSMHKMAGHDRHGAWFARRSVHEGLGFSKWKKAMQKEFPESLAVQTGPGAGSVRGIGGDRKIERHDTEGLGRLEVYELSAKFPPPTAPRDFVTLLLTSENALSEKSAIPTEGDRTVKPRHWIVVSIPCEHPDAPPRQGLVRGTYESVEIIREIPMSSPKTRSAPDLVAPSRPDLDGRPRSSTARPNVGMPEDGDPELNPVEWIMVTRSDPGGGIPRFLVDRGTPPSIAADAVKFLDWACARADDTSESALSGDEATSPGDATRRASYSSMNSRLVAGVHQDVHRRPVDVDGETPLSFVSPATEKQPKTIVDHVGAALGHFTPEIIQQQLPAVFPQQKFESDSDDDATETSSLDSFASAEPYYTADTHDAAHDGPQNPTVSRLGLTTSSHMSGQSQDSSNVDPSRSQTSLDSNEKELAKIDAKKRQLEQRLAASKEKWEKEDRKVQAKTAEEAERQRARHDRHAQKRQERYEKEMRKLDERASKEARKAEARRRKELEKDTLLRIQRERDEYKQKAASLTEENMMLQSQIGDLQRENTMLVARIGLTEHGQNALRLIRDDIERANSTRSRGISFESNRSEKSDTVRGRTGDQDNVAA